MNLLVRCKPESGYNKIFDVGECGMKLTQFGLVKLAKGESLSGDAGAMEVALVLIGGSFRVSGNGWGFKVADGRASPFTGKPHCLYLPRGTRYQIEALADVEFAFNGSPATRDTARPSSARRTRATLSSAGTTGAARPKSSSTRHSTPNTFTSARARSPRATDPAARRTATMPTSRPPNSTWKRPTSTSSTLPEASASRASTSPTAPSTRPTASRP